MRKINAMNLAVIGLLAIMSLFMDTTNTFAQSLGAQGMALHTVGLHKDGIVYTWGRNNCGQLGNNTNTDRHTPFVPVAKGQYSGTFSLGDDPSNKIIAVALGFQHSIALASDCTVYTWGNNGGGQLGDNTTTFRYTPVKVLKGAYPGTTYLGDNPAPIL